MDGPPMAPAWLMVNIPLRTKSQSDGVWLSSRALAYHVEGAGFDPWY